MDITCYTDGACKPNPGIGGWGWVAYVTNKKYDVTDVWDDWGGEQHSTNNVMELTALSEFFDIIPQGSAVNVWTDSKYAFGGIVNENIPPKTLKSELFPIKSPPQGWLKGWAQDSVVVKKYTKSYWKRNPIPKNDELWYKIHQRLIRLLSDGRTKINIGWVKGHNNDPGNEYADMLSNNYPLDKKWKPPLRH